MNALYILDDSPWFEWIRLRSTDSTNHFLRHYRPVSPKDMVLATADYQTAGRGQAGNSWEAEEGKNLLFSLLLHPRWVDASRQFVLSQAMALAVCETLTGYTGGGISIKWPNDIYWNDRKLCGTLIENDLTGCRLGRSVSGTGVNLNQERFLSDAPNPVSLKQITGKSYNPETILHQILERVTDHYTRLKAGHAGRIASLYKENLYRKHGLHPYKDSNGPFNAYIKDIEPDGKLVLEDETGNMRKYLFKEVEYILPRP